MNISNPKTGSELTLSGKLKEFVWKIWNTDVKSVNGMGSFSQVCSLTDKVSFGIKMAEGAKGRKLCPYSSKKSFITGLEPIIPGKVLLYLSADV